MTNQWCILFLKHIEYNHPIKAVPQSLYINELRRIIENKLPKTVIAKTMLELAQYRMFQSI